MLRQLSSEQSGQRLFVVLGLGFLAQAQVETVTLFDVANPTGLVNPNSASISVLGINSEGETAYVEDGVMSVGYIEQPTASQTLSLLPTPVHAHATFVEDASHMAENLVPTTSGEPGYAETCTWGSDSSGACVVEVSFFDESKAFMTLTGTGTKDPFTTLVVSVPNATSSNHASSSRISGTQLVLSDLQSPLRVRCAFVTKNPVLHHGIKVSDFVDS